MKNSGRRQVSTPVGNKTKRGAELEGTPKTPRSFEGSPCKPTACVGSFSLEPEDRRLQVRSRRPLQYNNLAKERISSAMAAGSMTEEPSMENISSPFVRRGSSTVQSVALSPICLNATQVNYDDDGGRITVGMKKLNEMPSSMEFPTGKDRNVAPKRKCPCSRVLGPYPSSPECQTQPLSGGQIFLWSNASYRQPHEREETLSTSKDTASSSISASVSSYQKVATTEQTDCEAESNCNITDQNLICRKKGVTSCRKAAADARPGIFNSKCSGPQDQETKPDSGSFPYLLQQRSQHTDLHRSVMDTQPVGKKGKENLTIGLDEIEEEIQRLTERLTELQLQKREWLKELRRQREEPAKAKQTEASVCEWRKQLEGTSDREIAMLHVQRHAKRPAINGAKRGTGTGTGSSSSPSCVLRAKSLGSYHELAAKHKEATPVSRSHSTASKLQEYWRRSESSASQRTESSSKRCTGGGESADRSKVSRRLSISGSMVSPRLCNGQHQQRSMASTPSRVVSSRYERAITPDACRASIRSMSSLAGKMKRDDLCSAAASSSSPVATTPLKKAATLRSGYPSRSGFATTPPTREPLTPLLSSNAAPPPSTAPPFHTSPSSAAQILGRPRVPCSSSNVCSWTGRVDSPKSTAALYKCLESLLEDSKDFFKRLSPSPAPAPAQPSPPLLNASSPSSVSSSCRRQK